MYYSRASTYHGYHQSLRQNPFSSRRRDYYGLYDESADYQCPRRHCKYADYDSRGYTSPCQQQEPIRARTSIGGVKYIRKDRAHCAPEADTEKLRQVERTVTPPTSYSSAESSSAREESEPEMVVEEEEDFVPSGSDFGDTHYYIPDVYPRTLCPAGLIPLPSFVSN